MFHSGSEENEQVWVNATTWESVMPGWTVAKKVPYPVHADSQMMEAYISSIVSL